MKVVFSLLVLVGAGLAALMALRWLDQRADRVEWARLAALQPANPARYAPEMVADLPGPARRYFNYVISPGASLLPVVEIAMGGRLSLGSKDSAGYREMDAHQILAAPHGFVWKLRLPGIMAVSGSDSGRWTRFRILGLVPVARAGGGPDHERSAFGRYVAEAVFWSPAAVLPGPEVAWEGVDPHTARVTVNRGALSQAVDVTVDAEGRPVEVSFMRWSNANPEKAYRLQPFGATASDFREVQGYRLPFKVEAGNMFGTGQYFAFYKAEIARIRFPGYARSLAYTKRDMSD